MIQPVWVMATTCLVRLTYEVYLLISIVEQSFNRLRTLVSATFDSVNALRASECTLTVWLITSMISRIRTFVHAWRACSARPEQARSVTFELCASSLESLAMTRHGRNATASAVYSYHERKKDTGESVSQSHAHTHTKTQKHTQKSGSQKCHT